MMRFSETARMTDNDSKNDNDNDNANNDDNENDDETTVLSLGRLVLMVLSEFGTVARALFVLLVADAVCSWVQEMKLYSTLAPDL